MVNAEIKAIVGGSLIDGTGKPALDNATVIVENARIKAVGQDIEIPEEAQVINADGKTVMPGMIDSHMHCKGLAAGESDVDKFNRPKEVKLIKAVFDAKACLQAGFTMIRDCGGYGLLIKRAVADGFLSGTPRIVSAGFNLRNTRGVIWPGCIMPLEYYDARTTKLQGEFGAFDLVCDGVDECIKATRYALLQGADFVKVFPTRHSRFELEELKAVARIAEVAGKCFTSHCSDALEARDSILAGAKTVEHAHVEDDDELVEMGRKAGVVFISTLYFMQVIVDRNMRGEGKKGHPKKSPSEIQAMMDRPAQECTKILKAGAMLAAGTGLGGDTQAEMGTNAVEMELLVSRAGFTPMEAIVAATKNGAIACYMGDKTGTVEVGKFADIIVVDGDPLSDIKILQDNDKIKMVMLEGKVEKLIS